MSTPTPSATITFHLPADTEAEQRVAATCDLTADGVRTWGPETGEAPDDVRGAIGDVLRATYGGWVNPWALLPRRVEYDGDLLEVVMLPITEGYENEAEIDVAEGPRKRLRRTLREYHEELGADQVKEDALLSETLGDRNTLREELAELERRGEVYQPHPNLYALTIREGQP